MCITNFDLKSLKKSKVIIIKKQKQNGGHTDIFFSFPDKRLLEFKKKI